MSEYIDPARATHVRIFQVANDEWNIDAANSEGHTEVYWDSRFDGETWHSIETREQALELVPKFVETNCPHLKDTSPVEARHFLRSPNDKPLITITTKDHPSGKGHLVEVALEGVGVVLDVWAHQRSEGEDVEFSVHDPNNNEVIYENTYAVLEQEYTVTLTNTFWARNAEDAVGQMATYCQDRPYEKGYRVERPDGSSVFLDADDIDWAELSEKMGL